MVDTKTCSSCGINLPVSSFYRHGDRWTRGRCKACHVSYRCRHFAKVKAALINHKGGRCERCGRAGHPTIFDFHHKDPSKKEFSISERHGRGVESLLSEAEKCELLCCLCHRIEHASDTSWDFDWKNPRPNDLARKKRREAKCQCGLPLNTGKIYCSTACRAKFSTKIEWPENLEELVSSTSRNAVAKSLGVSFNAVNKRLKRVSRESNPVLDDTNVVCQP